MKKSNKIHEIWIDMHSHILPGIDDGAKNVKESLKMLDMAYKEGIRYVCATSHYSIGNTQTAEKRIPLFNELRHQIKELHPDMKLFLGSEILYSYDIPEQLKAGKVLTINAGKYILTEFYPSESYKNIFEAIQTLVYAGYKPILAHMERLDCLWKRTDRVDELKALSVVFQMNTTSLIGSRFSFEVRQCRKLVRDGYIDILGTDMHGISHRPPVYRAAAEWIRENCGERVFRRLTFENPAFILQNKQLIGENNE